MEIVSKIIVGALYGWLMIDYLAKDILQPENMITIISKNNTYLLNDWMNVVENNYPIEIMIKEEIKYISPKIMENDEYYSEIYAEGSYTKLVFNYEENRIKDYKLILIKEAENSELTDKEINDKRFNDLMSKLVFGYEDSEGIALEKNTYNKVVMTEQEKLDGKMVV